MKQSSTRRAFLSGLCVTPVALALASCARSADQKPKAAPPAKAATGKKAAAPLEKPVQTITVPETPAEGAGAPNPDARERGFLGRSGTRKFKRSRDVPPGGVIKDLKGPGPV